MCKVKILLFIFIVCFGLVGCGKQSNQTNVTPEIIETVELTDSLENSKLSCGTIASNEDDTSIVFFVMDNEINISGKYCGKSFEGVLTDERKDEFINAIVSYSPKVQEKEYDYWPHTDEYPEMYVLFDYDLLFDNGYKYRMDGAECYPDDWDEFIEKIVDICELVIL